MTITEMKIMHKYDFCSEIRTIHSDTFTGEECQIVFINIKLL